MVKLDDVELLNENDKKFIEAFEAQIDKGLRDGRGIFRMEMHQFDPAVRPGVMADRRVWSELARRYKDAGWDVALFPGYDEQLGKIEISHPKLPPLF